MKIIITKEIHIGGYVDIAPGFQSFVKSVRMGKDGDAMILLSGIGEERWIPVSDIEPMVNIERIDVEGDSSRVVRAK